MPPLVHRTIQPTARALTELVHMVDDGGLLLSPPYQRGDVWTPVQRIALIRSLLLGVPVASIVLNRRGDNREWERNEGDPGDVWYACVDGKQRLTTLLMWMQGGFAIPSEWIDPEYLLDPGQPVVRINGLTATGKRVLDRRFLIPVAEARLDSLAEEAEVYLLINSAGTAHTAADLDRARPADMVVMNGPHGTQGLIEADAIRALMGHVEDRERTQAPTTRKESDSE